MGAIQVDWQHVFDTNTSHAPQNYDEIEAVLAILHAYNHQAATAPQTTLPYLAKSCARKLTQLRDEAKVELHATPAPENGRHPFYGRDSMR